ncbi:SDR family oxidoreductase [Polyangium sp. 15x6]|uniref:SDR family NAD(P)-dependent oxidoreductase n=1 Tax=Polyangium sp. 15x6 TaxID=3042687 RepID=UPI00249C2460|nr:SDR family oxidoreductase [Polyangium sp. 15x6]MDI3288272.1 SDR family oxidoreductase [Polyangium sp. 15x6]
MNESKRRALVLGGTGAVGSAVLAELARAGVPSAFTYHRAEARARALESELSARPFRLDLADPAALGRLAASLETEGALPDVVIHCAAVVRPAAIFEATDDDWEATMTINARSVFQVCREFGRRLEGRGGDLVFVSALDRTQSLPVPAIFAASQGTTSALVMAAAKDLGPRGVRANVIALGLLDAGIGKELDPKLAEEYRSFSALRRLGTPEEAAKTITWIALHNTYANGKVLSANGGI